MYQEIEESIYIDEDVTEQEVVEMVLREAQDRGAGLFRRRGQVQDRITVEYIGIQREEPLRRLQPRDEKGRFLSYETLGKQMWAYEGRPGTQPRDAQGRYISYAQYARSLGLSLVTGKYRSTIETTAATLQDRVQRAIQAAPWKKEKSGFQWRKSAVQRVKLGYGAELQEELFT